MVEIYIGIAARKLLEWTENLLKLDLAVFITRDREPQTNPEGKYFISSSGTAFQAYDQQIDIAADANSARVLVEIVKCCSRAAFTYQQRFAETLTSELQSYLEDPSSVSQGLAEYTIALMNDQLRSVDMSEPLSAKISDMLSDVYRERAVGHINEMSDGFFKLASQGHDVLLDIIFNDLKAAFSQLYTSVWYEEDLVLCTVATFQDYCDGAHQQLHSYLFDLLMDKLIERFVIENIKAFKNSKAQFRLPEYAEKAERDIASIKDFFSTYFDSKALTTHLDPLIRLQNLASSSSKMIFLDFYPLRKQYPDMPITLVESIIERRTDMDRAERREVIESIRSKESDTDFTDLTNPTIFSKISFDTPGFRTPGMFRVGF
ncbi:SNARE-binding exocyst subunit S6 [Entomophthora muscae]|nr:SNARE-binding exocyst subunit S6 [Entomophthora muscae]